MPFKETAENSKDKNSSPLKKLSERFKDRKPPKTEHGFKIKPKILLAILVCVCAALILLTSLNENIAAPFKTAASYVVVPLQTGINYVGSWIADRIDEIANIAGLEDENSNLKEENAELSDENKALKERIAELEQSQSIAEISNSLYSGYETTQARIISKDSSNWFSAFVINKGSDDGIEKNMNVVTEDGLVGIVTDVGKSFSSVRTIINDESNVSATFSDSSYLCIAEGSLKLMDAQGLISFEDAPSEAPVSEGQPVYTSSVSSVYQPGILIGYVKSFAEDENSLTKSGYITPSVNFLNLNYVIVIKNLKEISD